MAVATFDTLKFANTLKTAGVPPQQAEAQAVAFAEVIQLNFKELATKDDLDRATKATKDDLERVAETAKHDLDRAVNELKTELQAREQRLDAKIDKLDAKIDRLDAQNSGQMALLKWMFGVALGANLAVLTVILRSMYLRQL